MRQREWTFLCCMAPVWLKNIWQRLHWFLLHIKCTDITLLKQTGVQVGCEAVCKCSKITHCWAFFPYWNEYSKKRGRKTWCWVLQVTWSRNPVINSAPTTTGIKSLRCNRQLCVGSSQTCSISAWGQFLNLIKPLLTGDLSCGLIRPT